jgi:hypothetical protein
MIRETTSSRSAIVWVEAVGVAVSSLSFAFELMTPPPVAPSSALPS